MKLRRRFILYKKISAPILVQWEITPICNHNCIHCYNYWRQEVSVQKLSENHGALFEFTAKELVKNNVFSVIITGGEPLITFNDIAPHIKFLSDNGVWVTMNSNLTLLTPELANLLKQCGVKSILVSLPSADPETNDRITNSPGSFSRIVKGISLAQEFGFPIFVNMVIFKSNMHQITMTAEYVASLGIKNFAVTKASDPSLNKEFSKQLLNIEEFRLMQRELDSIGKKFNLKTNSLEANPACAYGNYLPLQGYKFCCAGKSSCTIGFNGDIRPCNRSTMVYGNIVDGLFNSWTQMDDWRSDVWNPIECSKCKLIELCGGGCKADAINTFGDPCKPDPLCDINALSSEVGISNIKFKTTERIQFNINHKLKNRTEEFGGILFVSPNKWISVDTRLVELLFNKKEVVTLKEIESALGVNTESASVTATVLMQKQILL